MQFLAKTVIIYFSQKTDFNKKNNYSGNKLAYFWLANN